MKSTPLILIVSIAPPLIVVVPLAPTKVAPPAVKVVLKPSAPLMLMPVASKLVAPSIVVVPLPGSPALAGSRSMPPTLSGRFAPFNSPAYSSRSLIAWPTSLPSKVPNSKLPLTTVLPVAASTVKLP